MPTLLLRASPKTRTELAKEPRAVLGATTRRTGVRRGGATTECDADLPAGDGRDLGLALRSFPPARSSCKARRLVTLPVILTPHPHVRVDKNVLGGSPYVVGSRVPVRRLWAFYRNGTSIERILKRYPQLGPAKVFDALAFALDNQEVLDADLANEESLLATRETVARRESAQIELPFAAADRPGPARPKRR